MLGNVVLAAKFVEIHMRRCDHGIHSPVVGGGGGMVLLVNSSRTSVSCLSLSLSLCGCVNRLGDMCMWCVADLFAGFGQWLERTVWEGSPIWSCVHMRQFAYDAALWSSLRHASGDVPRQLWIFWGQVRPQNHKVAQNYGLDGDAWKEISSMRPKVFLSFWSIKCF